MAVDYSSFQVGGTLEPLQIISPRPLLQDADPSLFFCLDFWSWVIYTYPGPRLVQEASTANMTNITSAVAQRYPYQPQSYFLENQFKFPLLAVYRTRTTTRRHTAGWESDRGFIEIIYALPPLDAGQAERILPILNTVYDSLRKKTTQGFDPAYAPPGGVAGQSPWGAAFANIESIGFGSEYGEAQSNTYGFLEGTGNIFFPCLKMNAYIVERDMYTPAANKFAGGDVEIDLLGSDGSVAQHFMDLSTQQAPSVLSLTPATGPSAGGTSVTITGTLFLLAPVVRFGVTKATSVVWNSATSITCTTPAISGPGVVSVTVLNTDGQAGSIANAFTYV